MRETVSRNVVRSFDWSLMPSFLAVVESGSFVGAARQLSVSQPTLSRRIALLEAQLGVPLFERTGRGGTPTAAARAMIRAARSMEAGAEDLTRGLARLSDASVGTVRFTTSHVAASWLLPSVLVELAGEMPGLGIELVVSNDISNLLAREADIAVRMTRPTQRSLIARKIADIPIIAAAHQDYLRSAGTPASISDLLHHRLVGFDRDDSMLRGFAALGHKISREQFHLRTDDQVAYGQLVAAGAGIGFVTAYNLSHWPGVVEVVPGLAIPPLECWLVAHREIQGNSLLRRCFDLFAERLPAMLRARQRGTADPDSAAKPTTSRGALRGR